MAANHQEYSDRHHDGSGHSDHGRRFGSGAGANRRDHAGHSDRFDRGDRSDRGYGRREGFTRDGDGRGPREDSFDRGRGRSGGRGADGERRRFEDRRGFRSDEGRPQRHGDRDRRGGFEGGRGDRFDRDDRRGGNSGFDRREHKTFDRGGRPFDRDERRGDHGGREERRFDRGERGFGRDNRRGDRGDRDERRFDRPDRGERGFGRDERRGDRGFDRDDRRGDRGERRFDHRDGGRKPFKRHDSFDRSGGFAGSKERDAQKKNSDHVDYDPKAEFIPKDPSEPAIPAGVSGDELDGLALRALATLSGSNKDIVARHLVMAGELIDVDAEAAYSHAQAAAKRAGRVDVVREAAALTAYASGRFEEALREVRAVRRMRGDDSLRAVEADAERGLGHPEKAVEIIDATDTSSLELSEQVELVLVSSGARADLGQNEVGLLLVDEALAKMPEDANPELLGRLMSVKADRLRELGRDDEADQVEAAIPEVEEEPEIVDLAMVADVDVDRVRTDLRGSEEPLDEVFDSALVDLDGVSYAGINPIEHAAESIVQARGAGMNPAFITNNSSRTTQAIADQLNQLGFETDASAVMTSAMDAVSMMQEELPEGATVLVVGGEGLKTYVKEAGFHAVDSADDHPVAVVQGWDKNVGWVQMSEAAYAIRAGAQYYATNLDITLPMERGLSLGNGSLVSAVERATNVRAKGAGKPGPTIYVHGAELVSGEKPLAVGDRLDTDIVGAIQAGIPSMHVLTGVHQARDVITAAKGKRPSFIHRDLRGLTEAHPRPKHHKDGTWTCGESQVAKVLRDGTLTLDEVELKEPVTVTLDSYRALVAAAWYFSPDGDVRCPDITVVDNDDPSGIVEEPAASETPAEESGQDVAVPSEPDTADSVADQPADSPEDVQGDVNPGDAGEDQEDLAESVPEQVGEVSEDPAEEPAEALSDDTDEDQR